MKKRRKRIAGREAFIGLSAAFWLAMSFAAWAILGAFETSCKLQEAQTGLSAECYAPFAVIFSVAFLILFLLDIVRIYFALSQRR